MSDRASEQANDPAEVSSPPAWSYEHAQGWAFRTALLTTRRAMVPWRLWRELLPRHPVMPNRLGVLVLMWGCAALLAIHLGRGIILVPPWAPWYRTATPGEWLSAVLWPHGMTIDDLMVYTAFPLLSVAAETLVPMVVMAGGLFAAATAKEIEPERRSQLGRGLAYSMASGLLAITCLHLVPLLFHIDTDLYVIEPLIAILWLVLVVAYIVWIGIFWHQFARQTLRLPRPTLWVIGLLLVAFVASIAASAAVHTMREVLFPSPFAELDELLRLMEQRR